MTINKIINKFNLILLSSLLLLTTVVLVLSIYRGIDFGDEGFALLSYRNVDIYRGGLFNFNIIVTKFTSWLHPGIIAYRWYSLILTELSSLILSYSFYKWLKCNYIERYFAPNFLFVFCFISIGNLLHYFCTISSISYNTLINFTLQTATGFVLYVFSHKAEHISSLKNIVILFTISILCVFGFFEKITTGLLQFITYIIMFMVFVKNENIKIKLITISSLISGCIIGFIIYFAFFQGYNEWILNLKKEILMHPEHSAKGMINSYIGNLRSLLFFILYHEIWVLIFPIYIIAYKLLPTGLIFLKNRYLQYFTVAISVLFFVYQSYKYKFFRSVFIEQYSNMWIDAYFYIIIILFLLSILISINIAKKSINIWQRIRYPNKNMILLLLLITPFLGVVGTANTIFLNMLLHLAPWFALIILLLSELSKHYRSMFILSIFIILPGIVTVSQIIDGNLFTPYYSVFNENKSDFFKQTESVTELPLLDGVMVDNKTKTFLITLHSILNKNNYKKKYPIICVYMAGVVYLMEGISPGGPFYNNWDNLADSTTFSTYDKQNLPPIILASDTEPLRKQFIHSMLNNGIVFPDDYIVKDEVYYPNTNSILKVYFPKKYNIR